MKKGDKVVINDGSFSKQVKNNELSHGPGGDRYRADRERNYIRKQYVVIETGCIFPNTGARNTFNNTIIWAIDSGKIVFIEERFLQLMPPKHKVIIDIAYNDCTMFGETVKISDKLYQEIKRES